jgi:hypothetical protein
VSHFDERFRFDGDVMPAWVCASEGCPRIMVRTLASTPAMDNARDAIRTSNEVQAEAKRTVMRSRARRQRAHGHIAESQARIDKNS